MKFTPLALMFLLAAPPLFAADSGKFPPPAKVEKPGKEADLAHLTLTAEAEKRLGITTAPVERKRLERTRLFGGEIILPAPGGDGAGAGKSVLAILPSLTGADLVKMAQAQIDADGQVEQAKVQLDAAKVALTRAEQLLKDKAGSVRAVDEARVQAGTAEVNIRTAQARRALLGPPVLDAASQPLFWVRVPVYVGDLARLKPGAEARVGPLNDVAGTNTHPARAVTAPPSANAAASTVDLFYEVTNKGGAFRLGQKAGVILPLREEEDSLVVPWSAVVHDVQGGAWVYENTASLAYTRRRVEVSRVAGSEVVLTRGVKPGARIVITGVAELFGTEFGVGK